MSGGGGSGGAGRGNVFKVMGAGKAGAFVVPVVWVPGANASGRQPPDKVDTVSIQQVPCHVEL